MFDFVWSPNLVLFILTLHLLLYQARITVENQRTSQENPYHQTVLAKTPRQIQQQLIGWSPPVPVGYDSVFVSESLAAHFPFVLEWAKEFSSWLSQLVWDADGNEPQHRGHLVWIGAQFCRIFWLVVTGGTKVGLGGTTFSLSSDLWWSCFLLDILPMMWQWRCVSVGLLSIVCAFMHLPLMSLVVLNIRCFCLGIRVRVRVWSHGHGSPWRTLSFLSRPGSSEVCNLIRLRFIQRGFRGPSRDLPLTLVRRRSFWRLVRRLPAA